MTGTVSRVLSGVLIFQLAIGVVLVLGDIGTAPARLPFTTPDAPRLSDPVRPGDQRRLFRPLEDGPGTRPARDPGDLPERLVLTAEGDAFRLEGAIAPGDAERIAARIADKGDAVTELILQSPGGSVDDALRLGRLLRDRSIATRVLSGEFCYSACPYLLAGGVTRRIADDASIGVHQHAFGKNTLLPAFLAVEDIQRGQAEVMAYLHAVGINPLVMRHALATPADEIYVLLPEELERYGFTTAE